GCKTYTAGPYDGGSDQAGAAGARGDATSDGAAGTGGTAAPMIDAIPDESRPLDAMIDTPSDTTSDVSADGVVDTGPDLSKIAPPRLIAPLSTATVTSRRPLLHWV